MSGIFGSPPTPPSPTATAGAQTASNVSTGIANAFFNNTNQVTPYGNLTYDQTGTYDLVDPSTGLHYGIPRFTQTQTLSPAEMDVLQKSQGARKNLAGIAESTSGKLGDLLNTNIDVSKAPAGGTADVLNLPDALRTFGGETDYNKARAHVEDALFQRLNPQLDRSKSRTEQSLSDKGIRYGSKAYNAALSDYAREANDLRLGVTAAGSAEQQQAFLQDLTRGQFSNAGLLQQLNAKQSMFNAQNTARQQYLAEQFALRNQPINEITALLSGSPVHDPHYESTNRYQIPTTDVAGLMNQNFAQQFGNYQQKVGQENALIGGLFGLAGNLYGAPKVKIGN
jgi:hypothetical protein